MTTTPHTFIWFSFFQEFKFRCFFILISLILQIILSTMYTKELLSFFIAPLLSIETAKALSEVYNFACFKDTEAQMALFNPTPGAAFEEEPSRLIFTGLTEGLSATYSVCFFFAFYFSCFLILYHIYAFLIPSTFVFERLGLFFLINITVLLSYHFFLYFYFFPNIYKYLLTYSIATDSLMVQYEGRISSYVFFVTSFLFWSTLLVVIASILFFHLLSDQAQIARHKIGYL